jgi:hypothetical protein
VWYVFREQVHQPPDRRNGGHVPRSAAAGFAALGGRMTATSRPRPRADRMRDRAATVAGGAVCEYCGAPLDGRGSARARTARSNVSGASAF